MQIKLLILRCKQNLQCSLQKDDINITKQAYGMYENGKRGLPIEYFIKLSKYYGVSTDFILGLTDKK